MPAKLMMGTICEAMREAAMRERYLTTGGSSDLDSGGCQAGLHG